MVYEDKAWLTAKEYIDKIADANVLADEYYAAIIKVADQFRRYEKLQKEA